MGLAIDEEVIADGLQEMIDINSVNPAHGGPGEAQFTRYLRRRAQELGLPVEAEEVEPGRFNLYIRVGARDAPSSDVDLFDAHVDTVHDGGWAEAFHSVDRNGCIYGRGACDVKCNWAIWLHLLARMKAAGLRPSHDLLLMGTIDEEVGLKGAFAAREWIRRRCLTIRRMVVAEPTDLKVAFGHRGVYRAEIRVPGKEAHSARPALGINAIERGARIITALESLRQAWESGSTISPLGLSTVVSVLARGGHATNMVPRQFEFSINGRIGGDRTAEQLRSDVAAAIGRAAAGYADPAMAAEIHEAAFHAAVLGHPQGELLSWLTAELGSPATVLDFGTNLFAYQNSLTDNFVVWGPGSIEDAHSENEHVRKSDLLTAARVTAKLWGVE